MRSGEGDKWGQLGRQRRPDAPHALELVQGSKRAVGAAVVNNPGGECGANSGQAVELVCGSLVEVHGCARACVRRSAGRRRLADIGPGLCARGRRAPRTPPRSHRGVDCRDLGGERLAVPRRHGRGAKRAATAHPEPERGHRRHEEQGAALGGSRHAPRCRPCPAPAPPPLRAHHRKSRKTVIATSPTICIVDCASLSAVSSGVWCQA